MNTTDLEPGLQSVLASLCAEHLREEERLLRAALPMARAVKDAFVQPRPDSLMAALQGHHEFTRLLDDLRQRRHVLRREISACLGPYHAEHAKHSLPGIVRLLPLEMQDPLLSQLAFVRQLAEELVRLNHWLSVYTRIHLDAYERLLRDLIGSASHSGRYGAQGKADAPEYRPLLEIHG
jgi:hypothetical protein